MSKGERNQSEKRVIVQFEKRRRCVDGTEIAILTSLPANVSRQFPVASELRCNLCVTLCVCVFFFYIRPSSNLSPVTEFCRLNNIQFVQLSASRVDSGKIVFECREDGAFNVWFHSELRPNQLESHVCPRPMHDEAINIQRTQPHFRTQFVRKPVNNIVIYL